MPSDFKTEIWLCIFSGIYTLRAYRIEKTKTLNSFFSIAILRLLSTEWGMKQIVIILVSLISSAGRKKYRYKINEIVKKSDPNFELEV